jgi:hypothetical protein
MLNSGYKTQGVRHKARGTQVLPAIRSWLLAVFVALLLFPLPAYQQEPFVPCTGLACTLEDLIEVPVRIFNYLLGLAALVFIGVIVFSGLRMMWYYAAESPEAELQNAKYTLTRGIVGFVIIVGAILIVNILLSLLGLYPSSELFETLFGFGFRP